MKVNYPAYRKRRKPYRDFYTRPDGLKVMGKETDTQECRICLKILPVTSFPTAGVRRDGTCRPDTMCRKCRAQVDAERWIVRKNAPPKPDRCNCCHKKTKKLSIDHLHGSTLFRGWLCRVCNSGTGKLGDNLEGILQAAIYLENDINKIIETLHKVYDEMFARTDEKK